MELEALPLQKLTDHRTVYRIVQKRSEKEETDAIVKTHNESRSLRSIILESMSSLSKKIPLISMLNLYEDEVKRQALIKNPTNFPDAYDFMSDQNMKLLSARDFSDFFVHSDTETQRNLFMDGFYTFSEGVLYHPDHTDILIVRESPVLKDVESVITFLRSAKVRKDCMIGGTDRLMHKKVDDFYREGNYFISEEMWDNFYQQAIDDLDKDPELRRVFKADMRYKYSEDVGYIDKRIPHVKTDEMGNHEFSRFLFGKNAQDFGLSLRNKRAAPPIFNLSTFNRPQSHIDTLAILYPFSNNIPILRPMNDEEIASGKYGKSREIVGMIPCSNGPYVKQVGLDTWTTPYGGYCGPDSGHLFLNVGNFQSFYSIDGD